MAAFEIAGLSSPGDMTNPLWLMRTKLGDNRKETLDRCVTHISLELPGKK
jgi:hypothetical protein